MSGTSTKTTLVTLRLPNEVVCTLRTRINGRRSRWLSVGNYLRDLIIRELSWSNKSNSQCSNAKNFHVTSERRELIMEAVRLRKLGWSQQKIADALEVPRETVRNWLLVLGKHTTF